MPATKLAYGVMAGDASNDRSDEVRTVIALLFLVVSLAITTVWVVALPLFQTSQRSAETCEMFVLTRTGVTKCVPESATGTPASVTED